ncbi:MAG TPA: chemotaxis protein CheB [Longimicrobiaceae bacterium]|nr:chemotaxis protein CheB [Longimicrobiaceae bacterium]
MPPSPLAVPHPGGRRDPAAEPVKPFAVVALAASVGGLRALRAILSALPVDLPAAVLVVQHREPRRSGALLTALLGASTLLPVVEAAAGMRMEAGRVYLAPPDRHLELREDGTLALSDAPREHHSRPSADVLFRSLAAAYGPRAIAVVLTGRLDDGSGGVGAVKAGGGRVIAQDRHSSYDFSMPRSAIRTGTVDRVLPLEEIAPYLVRLLAAESAA